MKHYIFSSGGCSFDSSLLMEWMKLVYDELKGRTEPLFFYSVSDFDYEEEGVVITLEEITQREAEVLHYNFCVETYGTYPEEEEEDE